MKNGEKTSGYKSVKELCSGYLELQSFSVAGEDEEAGATGLTGGDRPVWSVLHTAAGKTHFPQLGQRNSPTGSPHSHIQGNCVFSHYM